MIFGVPSQDVKRLQSKLRFEHFRLNAVDVWRSLTRSLDRNVSYIIMIWFWNLNDVRIFGNLLIDWVWCGCVCVCVVAWVLWVEYLTDFYELFYVSKSSYCYTNMLVCALDWDWTKSIFVFLLIHIFIAYGSQKLLICDALLLILCHLVRKYTSQQC